ncbi:MAG: hypothetical protein ACXWBL_10930, partial [Usitatibacter sp.]
DAMSRRRIKAADLHELLAREFRGTAGDLCLKCRIPMPTYIEPGEGGGPNWRIASGAECANLCHTILEDLAAKLAKSYDITQ